MHMFGGRLLPALRTGWSKEVVGIDIDRQPEVTSAFPLGGDQMEVLREALRASAGQKVQVATKVDPALLGGLVVKIGSRMIDSSLRTKLNSLKVRMKEVG